MKKVLKLILVAVLASLTVFSTVACVDNSNVGGKKGLLYKKDADGVYVVYGYKDDGTLKDNILNIGEKLDVPVDERLELRAKRFLVTTPLKHLSFQAKLLKLKQVHLLICKNL